MKPSEMSFMKSLLSSSTWECTNTQQEGHFCTCPRLLEARMLAFREISKFWSALFTCSEPQDVENENGETQQDGAHLDRHDGDEDKSHEKNVATVHRPVLPRMYFSDESSADNELS